MLPAPAEICCRSFDIAETVAGHPPQLQHTNKRFLFNLVCPPDYQQPPGQMHFSRWRAVELPGEFSPGNFHTQVEARPDVYDYQPAESGEAVVEWHVNFSHHDLFCAYGMAVFAQDEIQVAEHPALASLREALLSFGLKPLTVENDEPTPALVTGVPRLCSIATDPNPEYGRPHGLYGNHFARADTTAIEKATTVFSNPRLTNLIAMEAPSYGQGSYTREQIEYILRTAVTGFSAARLESERLTTKPPTVVVHTGFWGCGAYGGNRQLMVLLQVLAAQLSGIDRMVFHAFDEAGMEHFHKAHAMLNDELAAPASRAGTSLWAKLLHRTEVTEARHNTDRFLARLHAKNFAWGMSDGN